MVSELKVDTISERTTGNGVILNSFKQTTQALTSSSEVLSINYSNGTSGTITLTENISDIDFTNVPTSGLAEFTLTITQHATSAKTVNLAKITVNGGSESGGLLVDASGIDMSTGLGAIDIYHFKFINGGTPYINKDANYQDVAFPVTSGELIRVDAGLTDSYGGSGTTWYDLSGNDNDLTLASQSWNSSGYFNMSSSFYFGKTGIMNTIGSMYIVLQSNDAQAIYFSDAQNSNNYVGAFKSTNGLYHSGIGSNVTTYVNNVTSTDLYSDARHASDVHLVTFTGIAATGWSNHAFYLDRYTSFEWDQGGKVYAFGAFDDTLSASEVSAIHSYFDGTRGIVT